MAAEAVPDLSRRSTPAVRSSCCNARVERVTLNGGGWFECIACGEVVAP